MCCAGFWLSLLVTKCGHARLFQSPHVCSMLRLSFVGCPAFSAQEQAGKFLMLSCFVVVSVSICFILRLWCSWRRCSLRMYLLLHEYCSIYMSPNLVRQNTWFCKSTSCGFYQQQMCAGLAKQSIGERSSLPEREQLIHWMLHQLLRVERLCWFVVAAPWKHVCVFAVEPRHTMLGRLAFSCCNLQNAKSVSISTLCTFLVKLHTRIANIKHPH